MPRYGPPSRRRRPKSQRPIERLAAELNLPVDSAPNEEGTRYFGDRRGDEYRRLERPDDTRDSAA